MTISLNEIKKLLKEYVSGSSLNDIYRLFYHISLLKYSTMEHLKACHQTAYKVATGPKLKAFSEMGMINVNEGIYTANDMTLSILKMVKINGAKVDINLLPPPATGYGSINELHNTEVFVEAINLNYYCRLLYPNFTYLRPDALLVLKKENKYKLVFLEIEAEKSNWDEWLSRKRNGYLKLSKDIQVYNYWAGITPRLKYSVPDISDFCFSVAIIGNVNKKWGDGFHFCTTLRDIYDV